MTDAETFAGYMARMRTQAGFTLRGMAAALDISPSYYNDMEKGRRKPAGRLLARFAELTALDEAERRRLMELAGEARGELAPDMAAYVRAHPYVRAALRAAMEAHAGEREWTRAAEMLASGGKKKRT